MILKEFAPDVGFGTSGVRALVSDLSPAVVFTYIRAFIEYLRASSQLTSDRCVVGWDLRPSSPLIAAAAGSALQSDSLEIEWAGLLPTPALALRCLSINAPGIMITGSHIPFDRNGIKFYTAQGEILKEDEAAISSLDVSLLQPSSHKLLDLSLMLAQVNNVGAQPSKALQEYKSRYLSLFSDSALTDLRIGVYQHSAVGRDLLVEILEKLGAKVTSLGRSDTFVPIDTEAVTVEDEKQAAVWCKKHNLDAVVSTDGDGDRPWVCDEHGCFMRGDILGILTASWLGAQTVITPVNSNTALEKSGLFQHCERTRIGSPYVIEAMQKLHLEGYKGVVGFEANGGFLVQSAVNGITSLPTRDSALPILAVLSLAKTKNVPLSSLSSLLPARFTQAGRIQNIPMSQSRALIAQLQYEVNTLNEFMAFSSDRPVNTDSTDGMRVELRSGDIIHLRPSGNAPELRCYTESDNELRALDLLQASLEQVAEIISKISEV